MKLFHAIACVFLSVFSLIQMFYLAEDNTQFMFGFICMIMGVVFMAFFIIEEQREEISELKETLYKFRKHFMVD